MKIIFEEIKLFGYHGWYDEEQTKGHWFSFDIEIETAEISNINDDLQNTFNYENVYAICVDEMKNKQRLLETVVNNVLQKIMQHKSLKSATVKLFKHSPHKMPEVKKVGIELSAKKS